jgi:curved DNA-binding protein CbpA
MDRDHIFAWLEQLDGIDYYTLIGAERSALSDDLRYAFQSFAATFHPDAHPGRDDEERGALTAIFERGTEAYMVLTDPGLRARYDAEIDRLAEGVASMPRIQSVRPPPSSARMPASQRPPKLEDAVRSPSARPFARRAEELVDKGDLRQAKLQMVMATHMDPGNDALEAYLRHIEEQLKPR